MQIKRKDLEKFLANSVMNNIHMATQEAKDQRKGREIRKMVVTAIYMIILVWSFFIFYVYLSGK